MDRLCCVATALEMLGAPARAEDPLAGPWNFVIPYAAAAASTCCRGAGEGIPDP